MIESSGTSGDEAFLGGFSVPFVIAASEDAISDFDSGIRSF